MFSKSQKTVQSQKAISVLYFTSEQILPFGLAQQIYTALSSKHKTFV